MYGSAVQTKEYMYMVYIQCSCTRTYTTTGLHHTCACVVLCYDIIDNQWLFCWSTKEEGFGFLEEC